MAEPGSQYGFTNHGQPGPMPRTAPWFIETTPRNDIGRPRGLNWRSFEIPDTIQQRPPSSPESVRDILQRMGHGVEPRDPSERRDPRPSADLERQRLEADNELKRRQMEEKRDKARGDAERAKAEGDRKVADTKAKAEQMRQQYEKRYGSERPRPPGGTPMGTPGVQRSFGSPAMALAMLAGGSSQPDIARRGIRPAEEDPLWNMILRLIGGRQ